ncbi:MAG: hypothetical protein ABIA63_05235, partial [bacterium]
MDENKPDEAEYYFNKFFENGFNHHSDSCLDIGRMFLEKEKFDFAIKYIFPYLDKHDLETVQYKKSLELSITVYSKNDNCDNALAKIEEYCGLYSMPESLADIQSACLLKRGKDMGIVSMFKLSGKGVPKDKAELYSIFLGEQLKNTKLVTVFGNNAMYEVLGKAGVPDTGCADKECLKKISVETGAQRVLMGKLNQTKKHVIVNLNLYEISSGQLQTSVSDTIAVSEP